MATTLLITRADFVGRVEIPTNLVDAKLNPRILEAQDFDLAELMGDKFYYSFTATPSEPLLSGGTYVIDGITYSFDGIKPVLVYYAAARLVRKLDIFITPTGMMSKRNDFSDHVDYKEIAYQANQYQNQALAYWHKCVKYLDSGQTAYPLWKQDCGCDNAKRTPSARMSSIGGSDFNERYYYGGRR